MSIVTVARVEAPVKLDSEELWIVLGRLNELGWLPAAFHAEQEFRNVAEIRAKKILRRIQRTFYISGTPNIIAGDVFFRDRDFFYCMAKGEDRPGPYSVSSTTTTTESSESPGIELGLITDQPEGCSDRLADFTKSFAEALMSSLDGRRTRHMSLEWASPSLEQARLAQFRSTREEGEGFRFEVAQLDSAAVAAASVLSVPQARQFAQLLSKTRFLRTRELASERLREHGDLTTIVASLVEAKVVSVERLLECKKTGTPLTRYTDISALQSAEMSGLRCPSCGSAFSAEATSEGYSLSDLGQQLTQKSRWMTVWVTNKLVSLGVPIESILWNLAEASEEVDIVVGAFGDLWIFELKDGEFSPGHAYPFNYRRARYNAQRAVVITTDKVSKDAMRVLEEYAKPSEEFSRRSKDGGLLVVEGLDPVEELLGKEIRLAAVQHAIGRLNPLSDVIGYDLSRVLAWRFGYKYADD